MESRKVYRLSEEEAGASEPCYLLKIILEELRELRAKVDSFEQPTEQSAEAVRMDRRMVRTNQEREQLEAVGWKKVDSTMNAVLMEGPAPD